MIRRFLRDIRGNYTLLTAAAIVPIMGALALAVDYTEMAKQRQETLHALDAADIATARHIAEGGATETQIKAYAKDFFEANLASVKPSNTILTIVLPQNNTGGGTLKMSADLKYAPHFYPTFATLIGKTADHATKLDFKATSEIRLKNTLEVALVLDNSGSMDETGSGSGKKRMVLLKDAAKELVDTLSAQAQSLQQVDKPVQFAVVPFAASVNIGPSNKTKTWMDLDGRSPIHHENFTYPNVTTPAASARYTQVLSGVTYARGAGWPAAYKNKALTRFLYYDNIRRIASSTTKNGVTTYTYQNIAWEGCVESRPYPYNVNDATPATATPATLFVPMFGPDEPGNIWTKQSDNSIRTFSTSNSWWDDLSTSTSTTAANQLIRQNNFVKYLTDMPQASSLPAAHDGPNMSCTTTPITPLTDVSKAAGVATVKASIDAMESSGATNVPEGMAWGWRAVSGGEPFVEGRADSEKGNDKVVIVLTDGANTYYTPSSLGYTDAAGVKSTYSAYGYVGTKYNNGDPRIFLNTSSAVVKTNFVNGNYTSALNEQFTALCNNAKAQGILVMTVSLDLSTSNSTEKGQVDALKACSSESRFRKDGSGNPVKLYWNATGGSLSTTFKEIADELSNLRIVG